MKQAEFTKHVDNFVVGPNESCRDGQPHLGRYREAHLLFNGLTRQRRDPRLRRQVAVFGAVTQQGQRSYYVMHSDCTEQSGMVSCYYPEDQVQQTAEGTFLRGGVSNESVFLPASDSTRPARFGTHKLTAEDMHEGLRGDNNLPLPSAAAPISFLRDLVAVEKA